MSNMECYIAGILTLAGLEMIVIPLVYCLKDDVINMIRELKG